MGLTVLQLGWEFPPHNLGGLGTACAGIVEGLVANNVRVILVVPGDNPIVGSGFKSIVLGTLNPFKKITLASKLHEYAHPGSSGGKISGKKNSLYGTDIFDAVAHYTQTCIDHLTKESFDVIHAHDWMTYRAGVALKKITGKPLVVHVHATEFDRSGDLGAHADIYHIEKYGMEHADKVIAVSNYTKQKIIRRYYISAEHVEVVYNAVSSGLKNVGKKHPRPLVLFLGRLTVQKGPDYFLSVAQKILTYRRDIDFVVAGSGDMEHMLIERAAAMGIAENVFFTGFLRGDAVDRMYGMADVYVMPSVCEPFGIAPLEAMSHGVPVVLSNSSGVCEVLSHCFKSDFWDVHLMANQIIAILEHPELSQELRKNGAREVGHLRWVDMAQRCISIYHACINH